LPLRSDVGTEMKDEGEKFIQDLEYK